MDDFKTLYKEQIIQSGKQALLEHIVFSDNNIYFNLHSNENTNHHRPHLHVVYKNTEYIVTIDYPITFLVGNPDGKLKSRILKIINDNIVLFRTEWNNIKSQVMFEILNGIITSKLIIRR